jgi:hypothetical protein
MLPYMHKDAGEISHIDHKKELKIKLQRSG